MGFVQGYASDSDSDSDSSSYSSAYLKHDITANSIQSNSLDSSEITDRKRKAKFTKADLKKKRQLRKAKGPWGNWSSDSNSTSDEHVGTNELVGNDLAYVEADEEELDIVETSNFYGDSLKDYRGRSLLYPPVDVNIELQKSLLSFKCFLPKKQVYSFEGHKNGVTALEFLPKTSHLFLSGGNDDTIKIWDFYHDRKCIRDYIGHTKAIKALDFDDDGKTFISSSFDRYVKKWDTETGMIKNKTLVNGIPNDVKFRPFNPNEYIVGLSNSKINHYDDRVASKQGLIQVYDHHQSSILNLRYFSDGSKFISSSEDKSIRIWENQINIPIKQISDTTQHSMPFINIHPQEHYFCTQSMDNTIYSYGMKPKYKRHPKKSFKGHNSAGYGIGITFSPDGKYICSGDSNSRIFIWDWTTARLLRSFDLPGNKPITQVAWNLQETSKLLAAGGSGKIYLFD